MSYLGIDIGTSGAKAVVFGRDGKTLSAAYEEYQTICEKPGWYELDPRQVIQSCLNVIAKAAAKVKQTDPVRAIGISSQGEAFTCLDNAGQYLCNAMVSFDTRSQQQVKQFTESFGKDRLYAITGHSSHTLFSLFKILWLKENEPQILDQTQTMLCMGDLLAYTLTKTAATSHNLAARTMLFDIHKLNWSSEISGAVGFDESKLPKLFSPGQPIGTLTQEMQQSLLLGPDVSVTIGGHDQSCGALGVGAVSAGTAAYSIGTVECITPAFDRCIIDDAMCRANLATYPHVVEGLYTTVAFNMTGGNLLKWFKDNFAAAEIQQAEKAGTDVYDILLNNIPESPSDIFVLPHFTSTGTPYFDPDPAGAIIGLSLNHTRNDLLRAILEGLTYEMKLNLQVLKTAGIEINRLCAFGGGAKSSTWLQIKSDIMGMPISVLDVTEAGCLGAAMLAAKACGDITDMAEISSQWVKSVGQFDPDPQRSRQYKDRYDIYAGLYETIRPVSQQIKQLHRKENP